MIGALADALRFLSILPTFGVGTASAQAGRPPAAAYPWAGLVIGIVAAGAAWLSGGLLEAWGVAFVATASRITVTGGLHLDGLADFADGLGGGRDVEKRLTIMTDSRLGSLGALALLVVCGLQTVFTAEWLGTVGYSDRLGFAAFLPLAIVPAISRGTIPLLMRLFPAARPGGLGEKTRNSVTFAAAAAALVSAALMAAACFSLAGLVLWVFVAALMALAGYAISKPLGGLTGDCYGAIIEIGDTLGFLGILIILNE